MYLSPTHDLISSMQEGCSRPATFLYRAAKPATFPNVRLDSHHLDRQAKQLSAMHLSALPRQETAPMREPIRSRSLPEEESHERPGITFRYATFDTMDLPSASDFEGRSMSRLFRSQHFQRVWDGLEAGTSETRPPYAYTELIKLCILRRLEGKLTLNQLYRDLEDKFPFFATSHKGKGWKNTLRHNLSTQPYFIKLEREHGQLGKGHYWAYCPDLEKPTSLAQSSVVQLSALWPPSVSAATVPPREESARNFCSATEFQQLPPPSEHFKHSKVDEYLPRFETCDMEMELRRRSSYREPVHIPPPPTLPRRLSSPMRRFRTAHHNENGIGPTRTRSATISTLPRRAPSLGVSPASSPDWDKRRSSSSFWPTASTAAAAPISSSFSETDRGSSGNDIKGSRPALPTLPQAVSPARKSLGDYYLSHPIVSRRKTSVDTATNARPSRSILPPAGLSDPRPSSK